MQGSNWRHAFNMHSRPQANRIDRVETKITQQTEQNKARPRRYIGCRSEFSVWSMFFALPLQWRHNERDGISNHLRIDGLLNFAGADGKTLNFRVTGLCEVNWPVTGEFHSKRASNAENVSIWWRHHAMQYCFYDMVISRNFGLRR